MIGLEFRVVPPEVDESLGPAEQAEGYVTRLAREKATTVAGRERGAVVLAADTTVVLRGTIFGKPANPEEAAEMLRQLEGRKHQVMTAVAVALEGRVEHARSEERRVGKECRRWRWRHRRKKDEDS